MKRAKLKKFREDFARKRMRRANGFNIRYVHLTLYVAGSTKPCGATHCVQGWAELLGYSKTTHRSGDVMSCAERFAQAFGLTPHQALYVTDPPAYKYLDREPTKRDALRHIDDILAGMVP